MSRGLPAETVRLFRDEWHAEIAQKKRARMLRPVGSKQSVIILQALQVHEIRKIGYRVGRPSDPTTRSALDELIPYSYLWDASPLARYAIIDAVSGCSALARSGMSNEVAQTIRELASSAMLMGHLLSRRPRPFTKLERDILVSGAGVGLNLSYDGALYLRSISVVDSGGWILWTALRLALVNGLGHVEAAVRENFETARDGARRTQGSPFEAATKWLEWLEVDAAVFDNDKLVPPPADVQALIDGAR